MSGMGISRYLFVVGFVYLVFTESVLASAYYVDKNNIGARGCSDTWAGTLLQPFCTIGKGIAAAVSGDTVYVRGGQYGPFTVNTSGITVSAYAQERPSILGQSNGIVLSGASYVKITGFEIGGATGSYGAGIKLTPGNSKFPNNNIVENNTVHGNTGLTTNGIVVEDGSYNKIIGNTVYGNGSSGISVRSHANIVPNGITGNEIRGNTSYNNVINAGNADGISLSGPLTTHTVIADNIVYGNNDDGIDTWETSYNTITGNISHDHRGPGDGNGLKVGGSTTGGNNLVVRNISYNNSRNGFDSNGSGNNRYYHNVSYNNASNGYEDNARSPCTVATCKTIYINNIGYNNAGGNLRVTAMTYASHNNIWWSDNRNSPYVYYAGVQYNTLASFYQASGNRLDNPAAGVLSSFALTPKFTNAAGFVFTLQSASPAINKGDPANPAGIPAAGVPDIGAYEYGGSSMGTAEYLLWKRRYGQSVSGAANGDFSGDGKVNGLDYVIWLKNYGI